MSFDVRKLGLDRLSTAISRAGGRGNTGSVTTGDITRGEMVEYQTSSSNVEYIPIRERATGCFPVTQWYTNSGTNHIMWKLETAQNRIVVKSATSTPCDLIFYVW